MDTCKDVTGNSNLMLDSFGLNHFLKFVKKKRSNKFQNLISEKMGKGKTAGELVRMLRDCVGYGLYKER